VALGETQFTQHCRELTNSSPMAVLYDLGLSHATELLLGTTPAVTDIAELCGFSTAQYLATCFKARYGMSPSGHRKGPRFNIGRWPILNARSGPGCVASTAILTAGREGIGRRQISVSRLTSGSVGSPCHGLGATFR
jgi:AraC-like DNA-binding protein